MLGCENVQVYQFFYQSKEDFEKMMNHNPKLFILNPIHEANITIYQYDFGKQIPLQLIFDVIEQSRYFRLRIGQIMKIIEFMIEILLKQSEKGMFNHDLDPKNIWILFSKGSLGPQYDDQIEFKIQIQGRWQYQKVNSYNDKIYEIILQLTKIMDKSISEKEIDKKKQQQIYDFQKQLQNLLINDKLEQLYQEVKNLQNQHKQDGYLLKLDSFKKRTKRTNRIEDAQKNIQSLFQNQKKFQSETNKKTQTKFISQNQFFHNYQSLINFAQHFSTQLHDTIYSNFKKFDKQDFIDFNSFDNTQRKVQEYHSFQIGQLDSLDVDIIIEAFAIRGYLNYKNNNYIDPSIKIHTLIRDFVQFCLSETQKIHTHMNNSYKMDQEQLQNLKESCRNQIVVEIRQILIQNDVEKFQNNRDLVQQFQDKILKQYQNSLCQMIFKLF